MGGASTVSVLNFTVSVKVRSLSKPQISPCFCSTSQTLKAYVPMASQIRPVSLMALLFQQKKYFRSKKPAYFYQLDPPYQLHFLFSMKLPDGIID